MGCESAEGEVAIDKSSYRNTSTINITRPAIRKSVGPDFEVIFSTVFPCSGRFKNRCLEECKTVVPKQIRALSVVKLQV